MFGYLQKKNFLMAAKNVYRLMGPVQCEIPLTITAWQMKIVWKIFMMHLIANYIQPLFHLNSSGKLIFLP